jgi:hypothetical protein
LSASSPWRRELRRLDPSRNSAAIASFDAAAAVDQHGARAGAGVLP